jgi:predicted DNA-binding transcriptional regulator AlpA
METQATNGTGAPPSAAPARTLVNTKGAARHTGLSASHLNQLRVYGNGPTFIKLGARVLYDVSDLDAWLDAHKRRSTSEAA